MDDFTLDNRHKLARPYWARPSIRLVAGAGKGGSSKRKKDDDDDDLDEDDDEEDDDDEDEDDDEDDDEKDEFADLDEDDLKAELRKTRERLDRSSSSNAAKRKLLKKRNDELIAERKKRTDGKPKKENEKGDDVDLDAIRDEVKRDTLAEANKRIVRSEAKGALRGAGVPAERVAKAVGLLSLDDVDVDDDGDVDEASLESAIDALKKDWPELFPRGTRQRRRIAGDKGDDDSRAPKKKMTTTQMQVAAALGKPVR